MEYKPDTKDINPKLEGILTSGQDIIECTDLTSVNPLDLLGYTFLYKH